MTPEWMVRGVFYDDARAGHGRNRTSNRPQCAIADP